MKTQLLVFGMLAALILYFLIVASPVAAAESQTWKVRPGDNLEIIAATLEISKEEIKKENPGLFEGSLQIGRKLKLPLRSHIESKTLEEELGKKDAALKGELRKRDAAIRRLEETTVIWKNKSLWQSRSSAGSLFGFGDSGSFSSSLHS